MLWPSYKYVAVPSVLIVYILICVTRLSLHLEPDTHQNVTLVVLLSLIIPLATFLVNAVIMPRSVLPEAPKGAFKLLWQPLFIELLKFNIVYISEVMGGPSKVLYHAFNSAIVLSCCGVLVELVQNAPLNMEKYSKFYGYLKIWADQLSEPLPPSKIEHHGSVSTVSSENSREPKGTAPSFNLDSFSKKSISQCRSMPILTNSLTTSNTMDRLYSISPKNTLHLVSDAESFQYEPDYSNPYSGAIEDQLAHEVSFVESVEDEEDEGPMRSPRLSEPRSLLSSASAPGALNNHSARVSFPTSYASASGSSVSSASSKSLRESFFSWFRWLVPFNPTKKKKPKSFYTRLQRVQIKQKFSTYSLHNNDASSLMSNNMPFYGSLDLEAQANKPTYKRQYNCQDYFEFSKFSNDHLDDWVSPSNCVDPIFKKFGVTFENIGPLLFAAHVIELALAQFVSFMTFALVLSTSLSTPAKLAAVATTFICHLFCINFLKLSSPCTYKFNIISALSIRSMTFGALLVFLNNYTA